MVYITYIFWLILYEFCGIMIATENMRFFYFAVFVKIFTIQGGFKMEDKKTLPFNGTPEQEAELLKVL